MIIEESTEVVITIGPRPGSTLKRHRETAEAKLRSALEELRRERYEVDLYVRGSWRRWWGPRSVTVFTETLWPDWRLTDGSLVGGVILPSGTWMPAPKRKPPPEIVLRGIRRTAA